MHIEIQVALNFVISYLYNKLPRRRVNLFGEELDKALRLKFDGHWYPEKPFKGSAYRCLRIGSPLDPVIETAAQESGVELNDIRENLPEELSVWVDPGEVSYRIGEKGVVKILYAAAEEGGSSSVAMAASAAATAANDDTLLLDKEVTRSFNPEAQCFKPIESVSSSLSNLAVSPNGASSTASPFGASSPSPSFKSSSPIGSGSGGGGGGATNTTATASFLPNNKLLVPLTFTTATFAQTKFGSTKLKTNSKRSNRMSPTEFSNYIKQRAIMQQQSQPPPSSVFASPGSPQPPQRPRSLSPNPQNEQQQQQHFLFGNQQQQPHHHHHQLRGLFDNGYLGDLFGNISQQGKFPSANASSTANDAGNSNAVPPFLSNTAAAMGMNDNSKSLLDGINFNLNTMPYPNQSHHQHLLVAN